MYSLLAHQRNIKLGSIANKLGRINYFPADINEAGKDNQATDIMMKVGPYKAAEMFYTLLGLETFTLLFPINFNRKERD